mmetsp:Transcript_18158/g.35439  ORF Transcript_18158/g.35439 Transcript_18158/m.35439 type:complete len:270 (+) Transcript_18158:209-1018(+)
MASGGGKKVASCATCGALNPKDGEEGPKLSWCPCRTVAYCGKECQKADWPSHKEAHRIAVERSRVTSTFTFACQIRTKAELIKAKDAMRRHDTPLDMDDLDFSSSSNGKVCFLGGGQADCPKGPPFLENVKFVRYDSELWLVIESPGKDLRHNRDPDAPFALDAAQLTGRYLSMYYGEMDWRGLDCFKAGPMINPILDGFAKMSPESLAAGRAFLAGVPQYQVPKDMGPNPLPRALVEGSKEAEDAGADVVARSIGRDWSPLEAFLART